MHIVEKAYEEASTASPARQPKTMMIEASARFAIPTPGCTASPRLTVSGGYPTKVCSARCIELISSHAGSSRRRRRQTKCVTCSFGSQRVTSDASVVLVRGRPTTDAGLPRNQSTPGTTASVIEESSGSRRRL